MAGREHAWKITLYTYTLYNLTAAAMAMIGSDTQTVTQRRYVKY